MLADIHANTEAFEAVLADIERHGGVDEYWILGDLVGYGPEPGRCIEMVRSLPGVVIAGNHDLAAVDYGSSGFNFNPEAGAAVRWTAGQLTEDERAYLSGLPRLVQRAGFTLAHGTPRHPVNEYLLSGETAFQNFNLMDTRHGVVGHTHRPLIFTLTDSGRVGHLNPSAGSIFSMGDDRCILNPGSVGQPRDGDSRAAYGTVDTVSGTVIMRRVAYDITAVQRKMTVHNLPLRLVHRLRRGL